jgi:hypothetical protein
MLLRLSTRFCGKKYVDGQYLHTIDIQNCGRLKEEQGPVWQGFGSSKNGSGSGSSGGVASLVELSHFKKRLAK